MDEIRIKGKRYHNDSPLLTSNASIAPKMQGVIDAVKENGLVARNQILPFEGDAVFSDVII
jgi:hypothetical protein